MQQGEPKAAEELLPWVYAELRKLAACKLSHEVPGHTLQPTALVHEAYLRLVGAGPDLWNGRGHFFSAAAEAMRRILVENARRKQRLKHGGAFRRVGLTALDLAQARSDIYALGVLLYELLTGSTPFDAEELLKAGLEEMLRTIREKEPVRPSTRLRQTKAHME